MRVCARASQVLAIIGEQFDVGNEICGAVVSVRSSEDIISVWNRNADNGDALNKIQCVAASQLPAQGTARPLAHLPPPPPLVLVLPTATT